MTREREISRAVHRPVRLDSSLAANAGLSLILAPCIDRFLAAAKPALSRDDTDSLHRLRVNARRVRAALWIFRDLLTGGERRGLQAELRWLCRKTGRARDWDVFVEDVLHATLQQDVNLDAGPVAAFAGAERMKAHRDVQVTLARRRYARLLSDLESLAAKCRGQGRLAGARTPRVKTGRESLRALADAALKKRHKKLRKLARSTNIAEVAQLHRLRIRARALRYTAELLAVLYPGTASRRYISTLKKFQDELGSIHDLQIAHELMSGAGATRPVRQARIHFRQGGSHVPDPRRHLAGLAPFWN